MNYGFVIDTKGCIGCHACSTACKSENQVPLGVNRTWVKYTEKGSYPDVTRHFQVTRCNHCANPPCVRACPVTAMYQRDDGIVEFDSDVCIGCKACTQACPYDAIYIDPNSGTAAKCHYCSHRIEVGQEPACVVVCPEHAIIAGDLDDPASEISRVLARNAVTVRKPEQGTAPKVFYIEGNDVGLHPTVLQQSPESYLFSDVISDHHHQHTSGPAVAPVPASGRTSFSGAALRAPQPQGEPAVGPIQVASGRMAGQMVQVAYNAQHRIQWHWPIPAYIVTKGAAAGLFLFLTLTWWAGVLPWSSGAMVISGGIAVALMLVTSGLLLYDLDRPERFLFLFIRPQFRSWIARAAWILSGFSLVSGAWWAAELAAWLGVLPESVASGLRVALSIPTVPLALMTGVYTAFLFAQMEGRDMWQSQMTPLHMVLQTAFLGAGLAAVADVALGLDWDSWIVGTFSVALLGSALVLLFGEYGTARTSDSASRAVWAMRRGPYKLHYWLGGLVVGHVLPLGLAATGLSVAILPALLLAALGTFLYELAYVMAPQEIPNS